MSIQRAQYVLQLLVVAANSNHFFVNFTELRAHTQAAHSYVLSGTGIYTRSGETTNTTTATLLPVPPSPACEQSRLVGYSGGTIAQEIIHGGPAFEYTRPIDSDYDQSQRTVLLRAQVWIMVDQLTSTCGTNTGRWSRQKSREDKEIT